MIRTPGLRARAYLQRLLAEGRSPALPSLDAMSRSAGVSRMTMWKALGEFSRTGLLAPLAGRGYLVTGRTQSPVASAEATPVLPPAPRPRWQEVHGQLLEQVRDGTLAAGTVLPPMKQLRARCRTSYASLAPAIRRLQAQGLLERHGKGWRVHAVAPVGGRATLGVIGFVPHVSTLASVTPRAPRLWAALQDECRRLNLRLDVLGIEQALGPDIDASPHPELLAAHHRQHEVLGYLVFLLGIWPGAYAHLQRSLAGLGCPVAFLAETEDPSPAVPQGPARFAFYQNALSGRCGEDVARRLFALGHRRVAFFTTTAADHILHRRYEGLASFYAQAGCVGAISLRQYTGAQPYADMSREQARSPETRAGTRFSRQLARLLTTQLGSLPQTIVAQLSELSRTLDGISRTSFAYRHAAAAFAEAASETGVTAWVGADDPTALLALDWCRQHGVRVPGDLSIVGFDDSEEALGAGLTSYNFNQETTVRSMIAHVVGRRQVRTAGAQAGEPVELPGFVSERATCGPARMGKG